jgi:4-hydroxybenzoate polyprenyltransferase
MRSAGCIINDMWDKDIDKQVERTKSRPLASGAMTQKQSLFLLAAHLSAGLGILLSLNQTSIILGMCCVPLVVVYPLLKRITYWPQAFLGIVQMSSACVH